MTVGRRLGAFAVLPLLFALVGCSVTPGSGSSAGEARGALYETLDATESAVGGVWENHDDPTARGCLIPIAVDGEQYPGLRIGPAPRSTASAIDAVVKTWTRWGYTVETTIVGEITQLQGRSAVDGLLVFRVSEAAMTLQGESECRPVS